MTDIDRLLTAEFEALGRQAPHDADLAGSVRRRGRRQVAVLGSALAVVVLVGAGAVGAARLRGPAPVPAGTPTPVAGPTSCRPAETGPLPEWARGGFTGDGSGMPFVRSDGGRMVAILFNHPLTAPPAEGTGNKILWVARADGYAADGFWFEARLEGTDRRLRVDVAPAPGPSGVDLPAAGCWRLVLHWGTSYTDTISLAYETP